MVNIVYLTESRITQEINLWACLWGSFKIGLIKVRMTYSSVSWARGIDWIKGQLSKRIHNALFPDCGQSEQSLYTPATQDNLGLVPRTQMVEEKPLSFKMSPNPGTSTVAHTQIKKTDKTKLKMALWFKSKKCAWRGPEFNSQHSYSAVRNPVNSSSTCGPKLPL